MDGGKTTASKAGEEVKLSPDLQSLQEYRQVVELLQRGRRNSWICSQQRLRDYLRGAR